jgi:hypothetical protein
LLDKHTNSTFPCDTVFQCSDCEEVFENNFILTRHKNRKNPCSLKITTLQLQLQLKQLSIKEMELRLEQQKLEERRFDRMKNFELQERRLDQQKHKFKHEVEMVQLKYQINPKHKVTTANDTAIVDELSDMSIIEYST